MSSFSFGSDYGTDQIHVGTDDIVDFNLQYTKNDDINSLSQINAILNKERLK